MQLGDAFHEVEPLRMEFVPLQKRFQKAKQSLLPQEHTRSHHLHETGHSLDIQSASTLMVDFPDFKTVKINLYCLSTSVFLAFCFYRQDEHFIVYALPSTL